jgi:deoxyribonuclease-4
MALLGVHKSIAGGYHNAVVAAAAQGCQAVQLFTKNASQWRAKPLTVDDVRLFRKAVRDHRIRYTVAHDSYLINLGSPDDALYRRSIESFVEEMTRAERLGLHYLVTHPGAHLGAGEQIALGRVAAALNEVMCRCTGYRVKVLLETTAGQGTALGYRFEHLARILSLVDEPERFGVCLDTCHVFVAGYLLAPEAEYRSTMREFDKQIGLSRLKVVHLNDSLKAWGSRVDRHAHIGRGCLGLEPFRLLMNDRRFRVRPMILETPKEGPQGEDMDVVNLNILRRLVRKEGG